MFYQTNHRQIPTTKTEEARKSDLPGRQGRDSCNTAKPLEWFYSSIVGLGEHLRTRAARDGGGSFVA